MRIVVLNILGYFWSPEHLLRRSAGGDLLGAQGSTRQRVGLPIGVDASSYRGVSSLLVDLHDFMYAFTYESANSLDFNEISLYNSSYVSLSVA